MHVPDHLINDPAEAVAVVTAAAVVVGVSLRARAADRSGERGDDRRDGAAARTLLGSPDRVGPQLATAALVFALQMLNFPVLPGTSGHLLGGALAAALIGPRRALLAVSAVVVTQAVFFADGGVGALGLNLWLLAILPVGLAAAVPAVLGRLLGRLRGGQTIALPAQASMAAVLAPPVAALAFVAVHSVAGAPGAPVAELAASMVGVHLVIGIGEALLTAAVLLAIASLSPVVAARAPAAPAETPVWGAAVLAAGALSLLASSQPDGLERVAGDMGLAISGDRALVLFSALQDYSIAGFEGPLAGATAGLLGVVLTCLVATAFVTSARRSTLRGVPLSAR